MKMQLPQPSSGFAAMPILTGSIAKPVMLRSIAFGPTPARGPGRGFIRQFAGEISPESLSYPHFLASFLAWLSVSIYAPEALDEFQRHYQNVRSFEKKNIQAVGFTYHDQIYVVFRGTRVRAPLDWLTDLQCWKTGSPGRHFGFHKAWMLVQGEISQWIQDVSIEPKKLILSGHSLGGALATLAAFDLCEAVPIQAVVTFGSPRIGGKAFKTAYEQKHAGPQTTVALQKVTWRITNPLDPVQYLPPIVNRHVGQESRLALWLVQYSTERSTERRLLLSWK